MSHVRLVARPDSRMVEVPLEIEAELPRDFEGAAVLASSGLPRKVKIKAQRDSLKLSTAYRADQLLADLARVALRATPPDVQRVQEAAAAFVKKVRERRQDGATLLVQSNGRGKVDVVEQLPQPSTPPTAAQARSPATPAPSAPPGSVADRLTALERRLSELESAFARLGRDDKGAPAGIEARIAGLEQKMSALRGDEPPLSLAAQVATLPTPGGEPRSLRQRRGTAIDAFAEGIRADLRGKARALHAAAQEHAQLTHRVALLVGDAVRELDAPREAEAERLRSIATEAAARERALARVTDEVELYQAGELSVAAQLLERLALSADLPDPVAPLRKILLAQLDAGEPGPALDAWADRAAAACGLTLFHPARGDAFDPALHDGGETPPERVGDVETPGVRAADGTVLRRAHVLRDELPVAPLVSEPPPVELAELEPISGPIEPTSGPIEPSGGPLPPNEPVSGPIVAGEPLSQPPLVELQPEKSDPPVAPEPHPTVPAPPRAEPPVAEPPQSAPELVVREDETAEYDLSDGDVEEVLELASRPPPHSTEPT